MGISSIGFSVLQFKVEFWENAKTFKQNKEGKTIHVCEDINSLKLLSAFYFLTIAFILLFSQTTAMFLIFIELIILQI